MYQSLLPAACYENKLNVKSSDGLELLSTAICIGQATDYDHTNQAGKDKAAAVMLGVAISNHDILLIFYVLIFLL